MQVLSTTKRNISIQSAPGYSKLWYMIYKLHIHSFIAICTGLEGLIDVRILGSNMRKRAIHTSLRLTVSSITSSQLYCLSPASMFSLLREPCRVQFSLQCMRTVRSCISTAIYLIFSMVLPDIVLCGHRSSMRAHPTTSTTVCRFVGNPKYILTRKLSRRRLRCTGYIVESGSAAG